MKARLALFMTGFAAMLLLPVAVLAWTPPTVTGVCEDGVITWTVTAPAVEENYNMEGSFDESFSNPFTFTLDSTTRTGSFVTDAPGNLTLWVRFADDREKVGQGVAETEHCGPRETPSPTPVVSHRPSSTPPPTDTTGRGPSEDAAIIALIAVTAGFATFVVSLLALKKR